MLALSAHVHTQGGPCPELRNNILSWYVYDAYPTQGKGSKRKSQFTPLARGMHALQLQLGLLLRPPVDIFAHYWRVKLGQAPLLPLPKGVSTALGLYVRCLNFGYFCTLWWHGRPRPTCPLRYCHGIHHHSDFVDGSLALRWRWALGGTISSDYCTWSSVVLLEKSKVGHSYHLFSG